MKQEKIRPLWLTISSSLTCCTFFESLITAPWMHVSPQVEVKACRAFGVKFSFVGCSAADFPAPMSAGLKQKINLWLFMWSRDARHRLFLAAQLMSSSPWIYISAQLCRSNLGRNSAIREYSWLSLVSSPRILASLLASCRELSSRMGKHQFRACDRILIWHRLFHPPLDISAELYRSKSGSDLAKQEKFFA